MPGSHAAALCGCKAVCKQRSRSFFYPPPTRQSAKGRSSPGIARSSVPPFSCPPPVRPEGAPSKRKRLKKKDIIGTVHYNRVHVCRAKAQSGRRKAKPKIASGRKSARAQARLGKSAAKCRNAQGKNQSQAQPRVGANTLYLCSKQPNKLHRSNRTLFGRCLHC